MSGKPQRPFKAKYDGTCLYCHHWIHEGQLIHKASDGNGYFLADKTECPFYKECKPIYD